jgi:hypothetical protein
MLTATMAIRHFLLLFFVLYAPESLAAFYKCMGANGRVIYSDTACDNKADRQSIESQPLAEVETERSFLSRIIEKLKGFFHSTPSTLQATPVPSLGPSIYKEPNYKCDGRSHCSQMTSCEEATFFINNCPDTKMDGNNDGIPCEKQWCR